MLLQATSNTFLSSAACRRYSYQEAGKDPQQAANASASTGLLPGQTTMELVDAESATVLAFKYMLDSGELLQGPEARGILIDFAGLVAAAHPVGRSGCAARTSLGTRQGPGAPGMPSSAVVCRYA